MDTSSALNFNNTQIAFAYKSNAALRRDYRIFQLINQNWLVQFGTQAASFLMDVGFKIPIAIGMKPTVYATFCGGNNLNEASEKINKLYQYNVKTVLDYGVEGKEREEDFIRTENAIKEAILYAANKETVDIVSSKFTGLIPFSILEKLHAKTDLTAEEKTIYEKSKSRIFDIAKLAYDKNVSLFVDAEESWIQQPLDELTYELMLLYNKEKPIIYNTAQLYRKDRLPFLKKCIEQAQKDNIIYAVKLVRGAYMEKEAERAEKMNYENPIQDTKEATDNDYNDALRITIQAIKNTAICVATHNEASSLLATQLMQQHQLPTNHPHIQFSQLYGMSDNISFNLGAAGYSVHKYMPYGPVKDVIPYLIRRAQENTSVSGQMGRELKLLKDEVKRRKLFFAI